MQGIDVLEDIRRLVGDEKDVEFFERLVDITDFGGFYRCVLAIGGDEFREGCEERFDPCSRHRVELTRENGCQRRRRKKNRKKSVRSYLCRLWCISRQPTRPVDISIKIESKKKIENGPSCTSVVFDGCSRAQTCLHVTL